MKLSIVSMAIALGMSVSIQANTQTPFFCGLSEFSNVVPERAETVRFSTFNASLNRNTQGDLIADLSAPGNTQAANIAETIQRARPDVLLINEFDYDANGQAASLFQQYYLSISQNGAEPINYPYVYIAPSNTGVASGMDFNNDGVVGGPDDSYGFGFFEGQYGMLVLSRYPIQYKQVRTFQHFLWKDMPGAMLPDDQNTIEESDWYSEEELAVFRLSSKSPWDIPVSIHGKTVHALVSHPTPPVFDGAEDRNGMRNHDEIRFWADYVGPLKGSRYIYDDKGHRGGLKRNEAFVIMGDMNADPNDGDSTGQAVLQLTTHPAIDNSIIPASFGGLEAALVDANINASHTGNPAFDTGDFYDVTPGNLRVDYVLPSKHGLTSVCGGVFWPQSSEALFNNLAGRYPFPTSDHRMVWMDISIDRKHDHQE